MVWLSCRFCKAELPEPGYYCNADCKREMDKKAARSAVAYQIKKGRIIPGPCEVGRDCQGSVEAHHDNYNLPLAVRWLCRRHHQQWHVNRTAA